MNDIDRLYKKLENSNSDHSEMFDDFYGYFLSNKNIAEDFKSRMESILIRMKDIDQDDDFMCSEFIESLIKIRDTERLDGYQVYFAHSVLRLFTEDHGNALEHLLDAEFRILEFINKSKVGRNGRIGVPAAYDDSEKIPYLNIAGIYGY